MRINKSCDSLKEYVDEDTKADEISEIIEEALTLYFEGKEKALVE